MFIVDTNVLSELRRAARAEACVAAWANRTHPHDMYLSAITILEIETGALMLQRRDPTQGRILTTWIETKVLPAFDGRILPIDTEVAQHCARLHVPDPRAERDTLIAATALVHGFTIITRNVREFHAMGARVLNPWE